MNDVIDSKSIIIPSYILMLVLNPCNHKGDVIAPTQEILIQCNLEEYLKLNRILCKTKFLYSGFKNNGLLVYSMDIKVASYQDALVCDIKRDQDKHTSDVFLNYHIDKTGMDIAKLINYNYLRDILITEIKNDLSTEWCTLDYIINNALSNTSEEKQ